MASNRGRIIRGYRIESKLGAGAFGTVYEVQKGGFIYAMKKIEMDSGTELTTANGEINTLSSLSHTNIIKYIESFVEGDSLFIVMEFCNGGNLNDYLQAKNRQTKTKIKFIKQILEGVDYLHSEDVIHGDLKPDNIMVCIKNNSITLKIGDFGIAIVWQHSRHRPSLDYYTLTGGYTGPPYYTAPEIMQGNIHKKSDIFSLGCMIMAMFSKQIVPWLRGKQLLAPYIDRGVAGQPELIQIAVATDQEKKEYMSRYVPPELQDLVYRMVSTDWRLRPDASQILSAINN